MTFREPFSMTFESKPPLYYNNPNLIYFIKADNAKLKQARLILGLGIQRRLSVQTVTIHGVMHF